MSSKKAAAVSTLVGEYDVELMTENELRIYVEALQEEHVRMRKACNLYQKDKNELLSFLNSIQNDIICNKKVSMQKNIQLQEEILQQENIIRVENELAKAKKIENINQVEKDTLESCINLVTTKIRNINEEYELLKDITEKDREIEHLEYIYKLVSTQAKEHYFSECQDISKSFKNSFGNLVTEYNKKYSKTLDEFSQNKIKNMQAIWGDIPIAENNTFSEEIAKMAAYFKDIYWKNIKTIDKLLSVLTDLKRELNNITLTLRDVKNENTQLSHVNDLHSPRQSLVTDPSFSLLKLRKLDELTYENYLLSIKMEMLNKEYLDLKRKFMFAVRRIHQAADFKALLFEKKLSALQNYPERFN